MTFIRSAIFNLVFFCLSFALSLYGAVAARSEARALALGRSWARVCMGAARLICGIELQVTGRENLGPGAALIAAQHQSAYDTMVWLMLLPRACYVLKRELTRIPLFGPLTVRSGMIPVDRAAGGAAIRALLRGADRAKAADRQIVIFPEGTRTAPGHVSDLQTGVAAIAARTLLPVIPVRTDSGRCWSRRSFGKYSGIVHVDIQPPLPVGLPRAELMAQLTDIIHPVDNSVGSVMRRFPAGRRAGEQTIEENTFNAARRL